MKKIIFGMIFIAGFCFVAGVPLKAQEVPPECLNFEHGLMLRCIQRGIQSLTEYANPMESEVPRREAPAEAVGEINPVVLDQQALKTGENVYRINCASCHGPLGRGDGPMAEHLGNRIKDLTSERFQSQTDGTIFWKVTEGIWPMPAFGFQEELSREDIWKAIHYIRTLAE